MDNKKIPTLIGTFIIIVIVVTVGVFVWKVEKNREAAEQSQETSGNIKDRTENNKDRIISEAKDSQGCQNSAGFFWCEKKQSCVNNWNESCGVSDLMDISQWEEFNSKDHDFKFYFSFKYPNSWFNPTDIAGDTILTLPFYSKNEYTNICQQADGNALYCTETGSVMLINIATAPSTLKQISYSDKQKSTVTVDGYNGEVTEGIVEGADNNGFIAKVGEREINVKFLVKKTNFVITMKLNKDFDKQVFKQIISTLKFD